MKTHKAVMSFLCPSCPRDPEAPLERGFKITVELPQPTIISVQISCHRCGKTVLWHRDAGQPKWFPLEVQ